MLAREQYVKNHSPPTSTYLQPPIGKGEEEEKGVRRPTALFFGGPAFDAICDV